jgi:plasmid stability protein
MKPKNGGTMATMTLKNIPDDTYALVKAMAKTHHRSINSQIIFLMEQATGGIAKYPDDLPTKAQRLREPTAEYQAPGKEQPGTRTPYEHKKISQWIAELNEIKMTEDDSDSIQRRDREQPEWE